ncbi:MAG: serine/threonine protein kinase [Deltaproteobacteria bacterium]|nr:serine/threonine protein kinase [Deltaproteobacteria bacterium]
MADLPNPLAGTALLRVGEPPDPRLGEVVLGRYRILERLGQGGMGEVHVAEHVVTGKKCAVKTLLPEMACVTEIARRFEREARVASLLSHPNIVSVYDFGALDDGTPFMVMELVTGTPLSKLVESGPLAPRRALVIIRRALGALAHAHRNGVVHRDLKSDNLMVTTAGDSDEERDIVKILDFGIAKVMGDAPGELGGEQLTQAGVAFGTPDYMAPEQALGEAVDPRADLYSMGVILFELLTGRKPFQNSDKMAVLRMHVAVTPPSLAEVTGRRFAPELEEIVAMALKKRRDERLRTAEDMIALVDRAIDLLRFEEANPPRATGVRLDEALAPRASLGWSRRALLGLPALAVIVLTITLFARPRTTQKIAAPGAGSAVKDVLAIAVTKTERAVRAEKMLHAGDADGALRFLEHELLTEDGSRDAVASLFLGHSRALLGRDTEGLTAYERAVALNPSLAFDETMRRNVAGMLDRKASGVGLLAIEFLAVRVGKTARPILIEQASRGKVREVRQRALSIASRLGVLEEVNRVESHSLDLVQGLSCKERREAIPKLRALGDKRAIPALRKAIGRKGGLLGLQDINTCLHQDAREAIQVLESL